MRVFKCKIHRHKSLILLHYTNFSITKLYEKCWSCRENMHNRFLNLFNISFSIFYYVRSLTRYLFRTTQVYKSKKVLCILRLFVIKKIKKQIRCGC